mgnify:CR=1 FL=1
MKNLRQKANRKYNFDFDFKSKRLGGLYIFMNKYYGSANTDKDNNPIYEVGFESGKSHYFDSRLKANKFFDKKVKQLKDLLS